jgi:hypothetical protein
MTRRHRLSIIAAIACGWLLAVLPALVWPGYLDSPARLLVLPAYAIAHALHALGLPGVLESGGLCGWGWCAPTPVGWILAGLVLLAALVLVVVAGGRLLARRPRPRLRHTGRP